MEALSFPKQPENAEKMARYMKNHFSFCGVRSPERKLLERPFLKASRELSVSELLVEVRRNYALDEREYQYYALDLVFANLKRLTVTDLESLLPLVGQKSWWDSVDHWCKIFSTFALHNLATREIIFSWFYGHENFWYRRIGITLQLQFKQQTDTALLEQAILADQATDEFFIQKAIGWSLRAFSKTDPVWVEQFIATHALSKLAQKEGSKYI